MTNKNNKKQQFQKSKRKNTTDNLNKNSEQKRITESTKKS